ncbi:hypothetical protein QVD17_12088 [Tagetes erecta]|uniref:Uncharacterized protein n=1 Tax=Tagetes erecta TaxID=13708 RepID=A0AAD8KVC9_TARER|nr:hypothetical protein QVD17_12088 [Tagetes erecta]
MLGLFWEHPPALDPEVVGNMMQSTRDRIRGLEDRIQALLTEQKELVVRAATLGGQQRKRLREMSSDPTSGPYDFSPWLSLLLIDPCFLLSACVRNLPQCSVITSAKASAHSKLLKLKGNTYSTKKARHFLSAEIQFECRVACLAWVNFRAPLTHMMRGKKEIGWCWLMPLLTILASTMSLIGSPACEFIQYRSQLAFIQSRQVQWDLPCLSRAIRHELEEVQQDQYRTGIASLSIFGSYFVSLSNAISSIRSVRVTGRSQLVAIRSVPISGQ